MDLSKSQKSKNPHASWVKFVHTSYSDYKGNFRLSRNVNLAIDFGLSSSSNCFRIGLLICSFVSLDSSEESLSFGFVICSSLLSLLLKSSSDSLVSLFLLNVAFWLGDNFLFGLHNPQNYKYSINLIMNIAIDISSKTSFPQICKSNNMVQGLNNI